MTAPDPVASAPVLYRNGSVYTTADPFASAIIVEGEEVVWVGSEQAADSLVDDRMRIVDLDGGLVTPAFVDSSVDLTAQGDPDAVLRNAAARGTAAVVHTGPVDALTSLPGEDRKDAPSAGGGAARPSVYLWPTVSAEALEPGLDLISAAGPDDRLVGLRTVVHDAPAQQVTAFLTTCLERSLRPGLVVDRTSATTTAVVVDAVVAARETAGERRFNAAGLRLEFAPDLTSDELLPVLDALSGCAFTVCLDPASSPLASEYYRRGIPVTLGTGGALLDPWAAVRALLNHDAEHQRISARAAFTATTRGAWRGIGRGGGMSGQLAPGTPATYALWQVEALMVQAAAGTGASWSTDPRSRTPLLPALEDEDLPVCEGTFLAGLQLYKA